MSCAPKGTHFAFEPISDLYEKPCVNFKAARIYNYALSDESGETSFYILSDKPALSGLNKREAIQKELPREKITVRTERLDAVIHSINVDRLNLYEYS